MVSPKLMHLTTFATLPMVQIPDRGVGVRPLKQNPSVPIWNEEVGDIYLLGVKRQQVRFD